MDALAAEIVDADLRNAFFRNCLVKGGGDIYKSELRLQAYPDPMSFAIFKASSIPVPILGDNAPIDNVRFDVDLSNIPRTDSKARQKLWFP